MDKSVEPDGIHPRLLNDVSNHLSIQLARLFNNLLAVGEYKVNGNREGSLLYLKG